MTTRIIIDGASVPHLPRGVRLRHDKERDQWVVLAPERVLVLDEPALEVLKRCDGNASVDAIVDELTAAYNAPRKEIGADVNAMLQDLADKGFVRT